MKIDKLTWIEHASNFFYKQFNDDVLAHHLEHSQIELMFGNYPSMDDDEPLPYNEIDYEEMLEYKYKVAFLSEFRSTRLDITIGFRMGWAIEIEWDESGRHDYYHRDLIIDYYSIGMVTRNAEDHWKVEIGKTLHRALYNQLLNYLKTI